ncbi:M67 family metallopeptidase [Paenibacillus nanensis]|uniref:M67 family metallopeptidase n=1 Tax=Paenibacillus nanensis TaxID=393251 RepID=UPI0013C2A5DB|nr:M67 family metallopeptidase [Paenibacillus nanensis]
MTSTSEHSVTMVRTVYEQLIDACRLALPEEACGVLARGEHSAHIDRFIPVTNAHENRLQSFAFHPASWTEVFFAMQKNRQQLVGFYHSHPCSDPVPSARDLKGMIHDSSLTYWIISFKQPTPVIQPYRSVNDRFEPLLLVLA